MLQAGLKIQVSPAICLGAWECFNFLGIVHLFGRPIGATYIEHCREVTLGNTRSSLHIKMVLVHTIHISSLVDSMTKVWVDSLFGK